MLAGGGLPTIDGMMHGFATTTPEMSGVGSC